MSQATDSPSPPSTPVSETANVLTPTRRVNAILAQFDDSESEEDTTHLPSVQPAPRREIETKKNPVQNHGSATTSSEDDDLPVWKKSRIATRLAGVLTAPQTAEQDGENGFHTENVSTAAGSLGQAEHDRPSVENFRREDDEPQPKMRRRLLVNKKSSPLPRKINPQSRLRNTSPSLFPSSPPPAREPSSPNTDGASDSDELPENALEQQGSKSKFLALVEKHRKQRLAQEAAEQAKKAASTESQPQSKRPRGSSPADDSDEDSEASNKEAATKLSKQARPARKASKRANEEMKRETQRMDRNRQLTHQTRTKKRYTKEGLLASLGYGIEKADDITGIKDTSSRTASSAPASDSENAAVQTSPPTSPPEASPMAKELLKRPSVEPLVEDALVQRVLDDQKLPVHDTSSISSIPSAAKGKGRASDWQPSAHSSEQVERAQSSHKSLELAGAVPPRGSKLARLLKQRKPVTHNDNTDSDSDIEVITSRGSRRKYAAFEKLPQRKGTKPQSFLLLQTLAHLHAGDRSRHSALTAVELDAKMRKAARDQARRERQAKIEELKARGIVVQTAEERERDQQEVEDLVDKARQEAVEIQKRERELAKKDGTYVKDGLDDEESDEDDADYHDDDEVPGKVSGSEDEEVSDEDDAERIEDAGETTNNGNLLDEEAGETEGGESEDASELEKEESEAEVEGEPADVDDILHSGPTTISNVRRSRVIVDDDEEEPVGILDDGQTTKDLPELPSASKTPRSLTTAKIPQSLRSARKQIPGLQMSDDLPMGLSQAFAATMAESQTLEEPSQQGQDTLDMTRDLPSPHITLMPRLQRLDSVDKISDSQPATQTQPLHLNLSFGPSQALPESPVQGLRIDTYQETPSHRHFEPTQDSGYMLSPFIGNRFGQDTPQEAPDSTVDTVLLSNAVESPLLQRKSRLRRGRDRDEASDDESQVNATTAFEVMKRAAKQKESQVTFDKTKSVAKQAVDEVAEESEDEYAGLGGASDDDEGEENEDDRRMIDEDTQLGRGDGAKLAKLFADRERQQDEAAVSKLMKDITTGALRRKRNIGDLDLSDEEDATARRRKEKQRQFMKMQRELLKDEAVSKIAEDRKKEAFLRSIEDREAVYGDDEEDVEGADSLKDESQQQDSAGKVDDTPQPLRSVAPSKLNRDASNGPRPDHKGTYTNRPSTLAEIRESVSFLIEEPESQAATIDLGLSDSDNDQEAHLNLDRHLREAEADENADSDAEDLGDFIVDDLNDSSRRQEQEDDSVFKKPDNPASQTRAPFNERRTRPNVIDRLSLVRQASSSSNSTTSSSTRMAFFTAKPASQDSFSKVSSLLRRATTNSSITSENVSATGVVTAKATERGSVSEEKEFIRKGSGSRRNAVNYRPSLKEEKMSQRAGVKKREGKKKGKGGFLGGLFGGGDSWG